MYKRQIKFRADNEITNLLEISNKEQEKDIRRRQFKQHQLVYTYVVKMVSFTD